jgi:Cft2 family RNA processing exonuclease
MSSRTRRRFPEPKKAPDWVSDAVLERIGTLVHDERFSREARQTPNVYPDRLDLLIGHAGGSVPPAELGDPVDELVDRYGVARVALTMLRLGIPFATAEPALTRFLEDDGLDPLPDTGDAPATNGSTGPVNVDRLVKERDRLAEELRRERERVREKDRKLKEERTAHGATRSELTSDRDKARHALAEVQRQLESGPSGSVIEQQRQLTEEAEQRRAAAEAERDAARAEAAAAEAERHKLQTALDAAAADARRARDDAERARVAPPSTSDLLRAAQHAGTAALLRIDAPAPGDAELLEALAAISRWQTATSGGVAARRSERRPSPAPAEPAPEPSAPARTRSGRAQAAALAVGGPIRITIAGGGGVGSSAYLVEYGGSRVLLDCGIGGGGRAADLPDELDAVIISHAHGDHMGGLPELFRRHPDLRGYCSKPTKLLATYQANAAEEYIPGDRLLVRDPGEGYRILDGAVELTLHRVAHILGSCAIRLRFADGRVLVYSGDLGGAGLRTVRPGDPLPLHGASVVLLESTLGDRGPIRASHEASLQRDAAEVVAGGGCCLFPAANIGRAQELAAMLGEAFADGTLPVAPVWMTPLGKRVLDRYRNGDRDGWLTDATYPEVLTLSPEDPADEVVRRTGYVVVGGASALERRSGQLAFAACSRPECGVFFTGYSGPTARQRTTGDAFEITGEDGRPQRTTIQCRWGWSPSPDHASQRELTRAVAHLGPDVPLMLVHGVDEAKRQLAEKLEAAGHRDVRRLADGDVIEI